MKKFSLLITLITLLITITACSTPPASPTPDINLLATQAIQTYQAQLTQTQAALPTITVTPSKTSTLTPTATSTSDTALPTYAPSVPDKAVLVMQSPIDYAEYGIKQKFDIVFVIKNEGQTTWTRRYKIRYFSGWSVAESREVFFPNVVKPGEEVSLVLDAIAPPYTGTYVSNWKLTNAEGQNFYDLYLNLVIVSGPTRTPTPTITPTPEE